LISSLFLRQILINMNKGIRNRDKKIALLLAVAFAWLFIGSLVIFHQEHVLGKHLSMNNHLFISPKSKDKKEYTYHLQTPKLIFTCNVLTAGILTGEKYSASLGVSYIYKARESSFLYNDDLFLTCSSLRAPPAA
jgi:hypothetical protein